MTARTSLGSTLNDNEIIIGEKKTFRIHRSFRSFYSYWMCFPESGTTSSYPDGFSD